MATNFPTSVDVLTNPVSNDSLNSPSHSAQHANANDAIEAVESYLLNGGQGLTLVKKQVIGTGVSSVEVTGAFSSTYENYKIVVSGGVGSTGTNVTLKLGSTAANYNWNLIYSAFTGTSISVLTSGGVSSASFFYAGITGTGRTNADIDLSCPFITKNTTFRSLFSGTTESGTMTGFLNDTTSYTSFTLTPFSGTLTGGTIYVYGYGIGQ
jgi:hypothetical protein